MPTRTYQGDTDPANRIRDSIRGQAENLQDGMGAQDVAVAGSRGLWENPCEKSGVFDSWRIHTAATQCCRWDLCKVAKTITKYSFGSQKSIVLWVLMRVVMNVVKVNEVGFGT